MNEPIIIDRKIIVRIMVLAVFTLFIGFGILIMQSCNPRSLLVGEIIHQLKFDDNDNIRVHIHGISSYDKIVRIVYLYDPLNKKYVPKEMRKKYFDNIFKNLLILIKKAMENNLDAESKLKNINSVFILTLWIRIVIDI